MEIDGGRIPDTAAITTVNSMDTTKSGGATLAGLLRCGCNQNSRITQSSQPYSRPTAENNAHVVVKQESSSSPSITSTEYTQRGHRAEETRCTVG